MNALDLIRRTQADNRYETAQKQQARKRTDKSKQQFSGTYLGYNAEINRAIVWLDDGNPIACEDTSGGWLKPGQQVLVTIPVGSSIGFISAMPR